MAGDAGDHPRETWKAWARRTAGWLSLATVIVTWVLQSEVAQCLETANCLGVKEVYQKPWPVVIQAEEHFLD